MDLPTKLAQWVVDRRQALKRAGVDVPQDNRIDGVLIGSNFVYEQLLKTPQCWREALADDLFKAHTTPEYFSGIAQTIEQASTRDELMRTLREQKLQEIIRIAWRDLAGYADLDETLSDTSRLADTLIEATLKWCARDLKKQTMPQGATPLELVVMGLGKLGGGELNFSSDVDLVFAYRTPAAGQPSRRFSADEYAARLIRQLVQALDAMTADGYVYRVDLRLRPHGEAGRPALSLTAMEEYFQREGRDWERYAWIKARPVAGDVGFGEELVAALRPFVFRRYLDWSALEALRELKTQVEKEVKRRGLKDDIKLGPGGIREVEFIAQVFQLIRGGRDPALRDRRLIPTLERLAERDLLTPAVSAELIGAYRFLRRLENRLQMLDDRQTHQLPAGEMEQARLAWSMGYAQWRDCHAALERVRNQVQTHFNAVFNWRSGQTEMSGAAISAAGIWNKDQDDEQAQAQLTELGFANPDEAIAAIEKFRAGSKVRRMDAHGRKRLDAFMPRLLAALKSNPAPDSALPRVLRVVESITLRSVYLSMLLENPPLIERLCNICGTSGWMAAEISRRPMLLEELLSPSDSFIEQGDAAIQAELSRTLGAGIRDDLEGSLEALAEFKHAGVFQVALAQLSGASNAVQTGRRLSALARAVLQGAMELAESDGESCDLAIVAYGRLGAGELNYDSDLDLVFLYSADAGRQSSTATFTRQARRLTHLLTTPTAAGRLYEVDTRLRPDGRAGLLVSPISAYRAYQMEQAWTWELQALVRARFLIGSRHLREAFASIRHDALARSRESEQIKTDILRMRERMGRSEKIDDLKLTAGGLVDVEFLVQYFVLVFATEHPDLVQDTATLALIERLVEANVLGRDLGEKLSRAYTFLLEAQQRRTLDVVSTDATETRKQRTIVEEIWQSVFGG